jgi:hypothetical protein
MRRLFLSDGTQQVSARPFATPACLGADPAVLVHPNMPLALVAAAVADRRAGLKEWHDDGGVVFGLAADGPGGRGADIGAVKA